jgi:outer membrane protein OmpA-like peptidoglycan-associated protein
MFTTAKCGEAGLSGEGRKGDGKRASGPALLTLVMGMLATVGSPVAGRAQAGGGSRPSQSGAAHQVPADSEEVRLLRELNASGRVVVPELRFAPSGDTLLAAAAPAVRRVGRVLLAVPGSILIEAHTASTHDVTADQARSDRRAAAVKARLVAVGVPASCLFTVGVGGTKAKSTTRGADPERIELSRLK